MRISRTPLTNVLSTLSFILCFQHGTLVSTRQIMSKGAKDDINNNTHKTTAAFKRLGGMSSNLSDKYHRKKVFNELRKNDTSHLPMTSNPGRQRMWYSARKSKFESPDSVRLLQESPRALLDPIFSSSILEKMNFKTANLTIANCDSILCNMCLNVMKESFCLYLFTQHRLLDNSYTSGRFHQRKLLQEPNHVDKGSEDRSVHDSNMEDENEDVVITEQLDISKRTKNQNKYMSSNERSQNLSRLIEELRLDISKEPVWAMISVSCLMVVLMLAGKACGMRTVQRERFIDIDIEEDFHNVSVMEVIRAKKRYLPKGFYRLKRKLRRKFRRKQRLIKEKDISEPITDSGGEERLLYDRTDYV